MDWQWGFPISDACTYIEGWVVGEGMPGMRCLAAEKPLWQMGTIDYRALAFLRRVASELSVGVRVRAFAHLL